MNTDVVQQIESANYLPTDFQVEQLAQTISVGVRGKATYLRILVAAVQEADGNKRGQLKALNAAHSKFYPCVLKGVGGNGIDTKERERRGTFARTSLSTLRGFVRAGGDLRVLDLATLTKASLRKAVAPAEPTDRAERTVSRSSGALVRAARRLARRDPVRARELIRQTIEALKEAMPAANAKAEPQRIRRATSHAPPAGAAAH